MEKIFIGVSWPYASGNIHIGHLAGQYVVCDVFARYHRMHGNKVLMVSGSDSHGAPIVFKAEEEGITPQELVEKSHKIIQETYKKLGLIYENYTSTMTENHSTVVQNIFKALNDFGYLSIQKSKQYFDPKANRFLPDRYVRGTCPKCGATNARGDECPECGEFLSPEDLIDPYSTLSDAKPEMRETEHFFINLEKTTLQLQDFLKDKDYWREWVKEFSRGFIREGLKPRAVTRDMDFGVPVPFEGWEGKVIYVWIEAVVGYLSAAIEWAEKNGNPSAWEDYWKSPDSKHYYFIAGGNVPFHTIIWPAELIAYNEKYKSAATFKKYKLPGETENKPLQLPYDVPANKILLFKGKKMSKGDRTGIGLEYLLENYSPDVIRYFFIKYAPENHDREFIWKDFIDANNNELVANIGNFINRTVSFTHSKFSGKVPTGEISAEVQSAIDKAFSDTASHIEKCEFAKAVESVLELGHFANKYFNDQKPWETVKTDLTKSGNTIFNSLQIVSAFKELLKPFLPFSAEKIYELLNLEQKYDANKELETTGKVTQYIDNWKFDEIPSNHELGIQDILFAKLEYTEELQKIDYKDPNQGVRVIEFEQDEKLKEIPIVTLQINGLNIKKRNGKLDKFINAKVEEFKSKYKGTDWKTLPIFSGHHELHSKYTQGEFISAPENLLNYIFERGTIPNINTFVDLYNIISIETGITIGVHDVDKLKGNIKLNILDTDTQFKEINTNNEGTAQKGEYCYSDDSGIICRLDIKQCDRTKITEKTKNVFIILQGHAHIGLDAIEKAKINLESAVKKYIG